jgi:transposase-like protein
MERKEQLIAHMKAHRGNVSAIARAMGTARMQIHRWIRQYGVNPEDYRG